MKNKRARIHEGKRNNERFVNHNKPLTGRRAAAKKESSLEPELDNFDLYKNFDKFGNITKQVTRRNRADDYDFVERATETTDEEYDSIPANENEGENDSALFDTDASDLLSDLEEFDESDPGQFSDDQEFDADDKSSIIYSSSEEEEDIKYNMDGISDLNTDKEVQTISEELLVKWRTELADRPTFHLIRKILKLFEKCNFHLVSLKEKKEEKLMKPTFNSTQVRSVELENDMTCLPIFYEIVFTIIPLSLKKLLGGKETDQNLDTEMFKPNCQAKWGRHVRYPIKQFLEGLFDFLDRQVSSDSWQIVYVLKYGIIQYMPYILPFSALLKRLIRILVGKWSMATVFKKDEGLFPASLTKFNNPKGLIEKNRDENKYIPQSDEAQTREQKVRLLCFILLRRLSHLPMGNDNLLEIVLKLSYLALMRSNLGNATTRTRLVPFLLQSLVDLYIDQENSQMDLVDIGDVRDRIEQRLHIENRRRQQEIYRIGFVFIRELAIYLRQYIHKPTDEHTVHLVSWQFVIACKFWGKLFGVIYQRYLSDMRAVKRASKAFRGKESRPSVKNSEHKQMSFSIQAYPALMLVYPLQQIVFGVLSVLYRQALFPFRLHLLEIVLSMGELMQPSFPVSMKKYNSTEIAIDEDACFYGEDGVTSDLSASFIDTAGASHLGVSHACLDMLFSFIGNRKSTNSVLSAPEFMKLLRVSPDYLGTRLYADTFSSICIDFIRRDLILASSNIAFPSIAWIFIKRVRLLIKHYAKFGSPLVKDLQNILDAVQEHSSWIFLNLHKFAIFDVSSIINSSNSLPLHHYRLVNAAGFSLSRSPLANIMKRPGVPSPILPKK